MKLEDLKDTKIYLHFPDERVKFKDKLEKLGIRWMFTHDDNPIKQDIPFIYISEDLSLYMDYKKNFESFCSNSNKQIFLEDVLAIEEPKEECKFKPYDKVLVRDSDNRRWRPRLFAWHNVDYKEDYSYPFEATDGVPYRYCIPYDENLANTTKSPKQ